MLKMGASKVWPVALAKVTGNTDMSAQPIIDYFEPLITWLKEQNKGTSIKWDQQCSKEVVYSSAMRMSMRNFQILFVLLTMALYNYAMIS